MIFKFLHRHRFFYALAVCLIWTTQLHASFPKAQGFINDFAGILDEKTKADLHALVADVEHKTTAEIAVVTVSSLDGLTVEDYTNRLFKEWGIGKKGKDNGVLVLVAPTERKMRIEVGYGLESILPDGLAGDIIRNQFTPEFKQGNYAKGIQDGVRRIADIITQNKPLSKEELDRLTNDDAAAGIFASPIGTVLFFSLFVGVGFFLLGLGVGSRTGFFVLFGTGFGGMPLAMSFIFTSLAKVTLAPLAFVVVTVGYWLGHKYADKIRGSGAHVKPGSSGWIMGPSGGSGSSDGDSGGSDFGGGMSGGGGASGDW